MDWVGRRPGHRAAGSPYQGCGVAGIPGHRAPGPPGQNIDIARNDLKLSLVILRRSQSSFTTDQRIL